VRNSFTRNTPFLATNTALCLQFCVTRNT
jgi:hypothetical protein